MGGSRNGAPLPDSRETRAQEISQPSIRRSKRWAPMSYAICFSPRRIRKTLRSNSAGSDWIEAFEPDESGAPKVGKLPYIVIIIDELADLMMIAKERSRNFDRSNRAESACRRNSLGDRDSASFDGCHYGSDQGEPAFACLVPARELHRFEDDSGSRGGRATARPRGYAFHSSGTFAGRPSARRLGE